MHNTIQIIDAKKNEIKFEEQRDWIFTKKQKEKNQKNSGVKQSQQNKKQ